MISPQSIALAIQGQLDQVPGIGITHARRRIVRNEETAKRLLYMPSQRRINGWMISPSSANTTVTERFPGFSGIGQPAQTGTILATLQFQIEGYFGVNDEADSESEFRDLAWAVCLRFNSIGLLTADCTHQLPCDIDTFGFSMMAQLYFLHYCRIGFGVRGQVR